MHRYQYTFFGYWCTFYLLSSAFWYEVSIFVKEITQLRKVLLVWEEEDHWWILEKKGLFNNQAWIRSQTRLSKVVRPISTLWKTQPVTVFGAVLRMRNFFGQAEISHHWNVFFFMVLEGTKSYSICHHLRIRPKANTNNASTPGSMRLTEKEFTRFAVNSLCN